MVNKNEIEILEEVFNIRHQIIHGNVKDDEVKLELVEQALDALKKVTGFLFDKINTKEVGYLVSGYFFE